MAYKIVKQRTAWWPVEFDGVDDDGKIVKQRMELRFRLMKVDSVAGLVEEFEQVQRAEADTSARGMPDRYAELLAQMACDWRGVLAENDEPLRWDVPSDWTPERDAAGNRAPLNAPNVRALMNEPMVFGHAFMAFRACINAEPGIREGN